MKRKQIGILLAMCLTVSAAGVFLADDADNEEPVITVTGTGTVTVVPDTAQLSLGIQTWAVSTADAQSENSQNTNAVIDALKNAGVEEKNIATSGLSIYATYNYDNNGNGTLSGYNGTTTLTVSNLTIADVGSLIDTATGAGANQVNDISYSYSDSVTAYDQALEAALDRAQEKALVIAEKSGKTLGEIETIKEGTVSEYDLPVDTGSYRNETASADSAMTVMAGQSTISANVVVTYQID